MTTASVNSLQKVYLHAMKNRACKVVDYSVSSEPINFDVIDELCSDVCSHFTEANSSNLSHHKLAQVVVAVAFKNSVAGLVSVLACMKTGFAFHPVDPNKNETITSSLLQNFRIPVTFLLHERFISDDPCLKFLASCMKGLVHVYEIVPRKQTYGGIHDYFDIPSDLAYVISTSGSTGPSKLVLVSHQSILSNVFQFCEVFGMNDMDRILQNTSYLFDPSLIEILLWLYCGATLVVFPHITKLSSEKFCAMIQASGLTAKQKTATATAIEPKG